MCVVNSDTLVVSCYGFTGFVRRLFAVGASCQAFGAPHRSGIAKRLVHCVYDFVCFSCMRPAIDVTLSSTGVAYPQR